MESALASLATDVPEPYLIDARACIQQLLELYNARQAIVEQAASFASVPEEPEFRRLVESLDDQYEVQDNLILSLTVSTHKQVFCKSIIENG